MKILFCGLGGIGQRHCRNTRAKFGDRAQILAYRTRNLSRTLSPTLAVEKGVDVTEKYGVEVYSDLNDALAAKPDVTFITNPSSMHIPIALQASRAGSHLFIEKPISHNLEGLVELQQEVQARGLVAFIGYQLRFHPALETVKRLLVEETVGRVLSVHAEVGEYLPGWHKYENYREMYASRSDMGGGVVLSQIHEIDYLCDWFGQPKRVFAIGGHLSNLEIDTEDHAKVLMEMAADDRLLPVSLHMDYNQRPPSRGCKIVGEEGRIEMDLVRQVVVVSRPDGEETHDFSDFERNTMFVRELDHFFKCIEGGETPRVDVEKGTTSLRVALAIKESMGAGHAIDL
jgi:predicted dehydrogenase